MKTSTAQDLTFHSSSMSGYGAPVTKLRIVGENEMAGESSVIDLAAAKSHTGDTSKRPAFERINPSQPDPVKPKASIFKKYGLIIAGCAVVVMGMAGYDYYQTFRSKSAGELTDAPPKPSLSAPAKNVASLEANKKSVDAPAPQTNIENQLQPGESLEKNLDNSSELTNADMEAAQKLLSSADGPIVQAEAKDAMTSGDIRIDNIETLGRDTATQVSAIVPEIKQLNERLSKTEADSLANKKAITQLSQIVSTTTKDMEKVKTELGAAKQKIEVLDTKIENLYVLVEPILKGQSQAASKAKPSVTEKRGSGEQAIAEAKKKIEIANAVPQELSGLKLVAVQGNRAVIKIMESGKSALVEVGQSYQNLGKVDQIQDGKISGHFDDGKLWLIK